MKLQKKQLNKDVCTSCFRIQCKHCGWIATEKEVFAIQQGSIAACPVCGWKPGDKID